MVIRIERAEVVALLRDFGEVVVLLGCYDSFGVAGGLW